VREKSKEGVGIPRSRVVPDAVGVTGAAAPSARRALVMRPA
jgi:hypothetical protein